jgi:membrane-bound serine protease (ClpP class)
MRRDARSVEDARGFRRLLLVLAVALAPGAPWQPEPAAQAPYEARVTILELEGVVSPFSARYLTRELDRAAQRGDAAVVLRLDTPGGLVDSTRAMTQAMLGSPVPVVVYVAPSGARAASAGMFLLMAGHVAAMAPGTNVGAAHPVGVGGTADEVMSEKVVNDAVAMARAIAETRGRNAAWAEQAVRKSISATADEAVKRKVADLLADDLDTLLATLDGRIVTTPAGSVRLATRDAARVTSPMTLPERILQVVVHPNIAYILFTMGLIGLAAELYNPGLLFPGLAGVISLLLAFTAFGVLPVSWGGLALLVIGLALLGFDLASEGVGFMAAGGVLAFIAGSLLLYSPRDPASPAMPDLRVSGWLVAVMAGLVGAFFLVVARAVLRAQRVPVSAGAETLIGRTGVAKTDLAPTGTVDVDAETWSAVAEEPIRRGEPIRVVRVEGVRLRVARFASQEA